MDQQRNAANSQLEPMSSRRQFALGGPPQRSSLIAQARFATRAAWVLGFTALLLAVGVASARAAFPGRNGLLVVQPASGGGLMLVGADGANPQQICAVAMPCD